MVHPKATILAIGPIVIGQNCIIEESVIIVNRLIFKLLDTFKSADPSLDGKKSCVSGMTTFSRLDVVCVPSGMYNQLNTQTITLGVESPSVGNANTISTRARLHHTVRLTSYCVIGSGCLVAPSQDEILEEFTV